MSPDQISTFFNMYRHKSPLLSHAQYTCSSFSKYSEQGNYHLSFSKYSEQSKGQVGLPKVMTSRGAGGFSSAFFKVCLFFIEKAEAVTSKPFQQQRKELFLAD